MQIPLPPPKSPFEKPKVSKLLNRYKDPIPVNAVYIGRPSIWGNPFVIGKDGTREEVIEKYEKWLLGQPNLLSQLYTLRDKDLVCYCSPKLCHGNVLLKLLVGHITTSF